MDFKEPTLIPSSAFPTTTLPRRLADTALTISTPMPAASNRHIGKALIGEFKVQQILLTRFSDRAPPSGFQTAFTWLKLHFFYHRRSVQSRRRVGLTSTQKRSILELIEEKAMVMKVTFRRICYRGQRIGYPPLKPEPVQLGNPQPLSSG